MQAQQFHNQMAMGVFRPIYPVIARNILQKSQVRKGHCVDVGGGSGVLGLKLARNSRLSFRIKERKIPACAGMNFEVINTC